MRPRPRSLDFVFSALIVSAETAVGLMMRGRTELTEIVMVYLLGVVFVASRCGRGPAVLASTLSVLAFNFGVVPPYSTLAVSELRFLGTFAVMFVVGLLGHDARAGRGLQIKKEWVPLEEVVGSALNRLESILGSRRAVIDRPAELPLVPLDSVLILGLPNGYGAELVQRPAVVVRSDRGSFRA